MAIEVPDPPKEDVDVSSVEATSFVDGIIGRNNESDSDDGPNEDHLGYEPLSMDPSNNPHSFSDSEDEEEEDTANEAHEIKPAANPQDVPTTSDFDQATATEISKVWNAPRADKSTPMDAEQAAQVLKAMEGFSLPASATPSWAKGISDEEWKKHVADKILNSKS